MWKWLLPSLLFFSGTAFAQDTRYTSTMELGRYLITTAATTKATLQTATDWQEFIMTSREATPVTDVCYMHGVTTGTPPTYKIGIEGVNTATGRADGVYATGTGECSLSFTPPADSSINGLGVCHTLTGTTCALTRGQLFAVTIRYESGTISGAANSSFVRGFSAGFNNSRSSPSANNSYPVSVSTGTGTKSNLTPTVWWKNSVTGRVFGNPVSGAPSHSYNSGSTPDEYALRFQNPCPTGQQYEVSGGNFFSTTCATGKTLLVRLFDGVTVLQTATIYCDVSVVIASALPTEFLFTDAALVPLNCGATYRVGIAPQETSSGSTWYSTTVATNADYDAWPWGKETYLSSRTDGGAWTDITNERPAMSLMINRYIAPPVAPVIHGGHLSKPFNKGFQP